MTHPPPVPGLRPALAVAAELHRQLVALAKRPYGPAELLYRARRLLVRYEPLLARTLKDSLLLAWLRAARVLAQRLPPIGPPRSPIPSALFLPDDGQPIIRLPQVEAAARDLLRRQVLLPDDFRRLDQDARRAAFTVARVQSAAALERVRKALVEDLEQGGTLRDFHRRVAADLDPVLSRSQVEAVYRTQIAQATGAGQREVLAHPLVADEFPYVLYTAIHDARTRHTHLELERLGLNKTAVYRRDDPVAQEFWPPWDWNCRCHFIPISIEDAARYGCREAREWVRAGVPPTSPQYVAHPPFEPSASWRAAAGSGRITAIL